jgi:phenylpropionate dioxygenase-like ring-hydroxylating dioxygenase large terminal subunit
VTTLDDAPGSARSSGPSVRDLLAAEDAPLPRGLADDAYEHQGTADVPRARYFSKAWHDLEVAHVWRTTWQMACRAEEIPEPGDHVVYDVAGESLMVTRVDPTTVRAFHNSCLHRGTQLRVDGGNVTRFRCPFHGWTWNLDGSLAEIPNHWDFTHVDAEKLNLPEAHVAEWGGWIFVNLAVDPVPFEEYAARLVDHFQDWPLEQRYVQFHASKVVPTNWKVCMEGYHVIDTHPQILEFTGDANTEYSVWPGDPHVSRMINAFGVPSPHLEEVGEQEVADAHLGFFARLPAGTVTVPEGGTARRAVADVMRTALSSTTGVDHGGITDCEALDAIEYYLFPNFAPWAGVLQSLVYRWRPNGDDPESCVMDVYRLATYDPAGPRPATAPHTRLTVDQPWSDAPGMGGLAAVFAQDMANLPRVQRGLHSTGKPGVSFGSYQEVRIRHIHRTIDRYVRAGLARAGVDPTPEVAALFVPDA